MTPRPRPPVAALCLAVMALAAAFPALAQWRDGGPNGSRVIGGGGRVAAYHDRGERGARSQGGGWRAGGGFRESAPRGYRGFDGAAYPDSYSRVYEAPAYGGARAYDAGRRRFAPSVGAPSFAARREPQGDPRAWRRGEVLPDGYREATVADPGRYHLRRAPNGYDWVGDARNAYLMQRSTGLVLDSVPGAYEPPPPYRRDRRRP